MGDLLRRFALAQGFRELSASLLPLESMVRQKSLSQRDGSPKNLPPRDCHIVSQLGITASLKVSGVHTL